MTNTTTATATTEPVYVDQAWHETDNGRREFRATDDPRLLAVIERDEGAQGPDGDVYAPAYWAEYRGGWDLNRAGGGFDDDDARAAVETAWNTWGHGHDLAARFLKAFHGITVYEQRGPSQGDLLVVLDTPAYRETVGTPDDMTPDDLTRPTRDTWGAFIDGDVYGVGYAVNPLRIDPAAPVDLDDGEWDVNLEVWGFYGTEYARESALEMDEGPDLPALDALTTSAVDAMTAQAARDDAPAAVAELVASYDLLVSNWEAECARHDDDPPSSSWEAYDDARLDLLDALADAVRPLI